LNLVLFEAGEVNTPLPRTDARVGHILTVLRLQVGDRFDAGVINGPRGKATLTAIGPEEVGFSFIATVEPPPLDDVHLLLGLPRPQTARKILNEVAALGVASLHFFPAEKGERSYGTSSLWTSDEWRRHLKEGAAQAFDTRLPEVRHAAHLSAAVAGLPAGHRVALDNYEAPGRLIPTANRPLTLAFGPERGWSATERTSLRSAGFTLAHLGSRVLRTETAVVAAVAVAKALA